MSSEKMKPVRLQRSRKKGAKLVSPNGLPVECVSRPGKYGNPFVAGMSAHEAEQSAAKAGRMRIDLEDAPNTVAQAVELYRWWLIAVPQRMNDPMPSAGEIAVDLCGKNLADWCKLCPEHAAGKPFDVKCEKCAPCHADVLLELANASISAQPSALGAGRGKE